MFLLNKFPKKVPLTLAFTSTVATVTVSYLLYQRVQKQNKIQLESGFQTDSLSLPKFKVLDFSSLGVYLWGNNKTGISDPSLTSVDTVKLPKSLTGFDKVPIRSLALGPNHAVLVDMYGDVFQWGYGYFGTQVDEHKSPELSLKGKDIKEVKVSENKVVLKDGSGNLFILPASKRYQKKDGGGKVVADKLLFPNLGWFEKVEEFSTGQHHLVVRTNKNNLFTLPLDSQALTDGQLGLLDPKFNFNYADDKFQDYCLHPVPLHLDTKDTVDSLATGNNHTLIKTRQGKVFGFGSNFYGQLGLGDFKLKTVNQLVPMEITHCITNNAPHLKVDQVVAGGDTSLFVVKEENQGNQVYTCGQGIYGQLGNKKYTHMQGQPSLVPTVSNLLQYDEQLQRNLPIQFYSIQMGNSHTFLTLNSNAPQTFGRDVLVWGRNHQFQCGTGKCNNLNQPTSPLPYLHLNRQFEKDRDQLMENKVRFQVPDKRSVHFVQGGKPVTQTVEVKLVAGYDSSAMYFQLVE